MNHKAYPLEIFLELQEIVENAFIYKLKKKNPSISEESIKKAVTDWYHIREGAENGDAEGTVGDIRRFNR